MLLDRLFRRKYEMVPLVWEELYWKGVIADQPILQRGQLFLAVSGLPPNQVHFPGRLQNRRVRAHPAGDAELRQRGRNHPGLVPPPAIPRRDSFYFKHYHRESPGFANLLHTGQIAVFVAGAMPVAKLEIVGLRPKEES